MVILQVELLILDKQKKEHVPNSIIFFVTYKIW